MTYQEVLKLVEYPETCLVIDFETYYDTEYSLKKMSTIEYIQHRLFDFTGMGYQKINLSTIPTDGATYFIPKPDLLEVIFNLKNQNGHNFEGVTVVVKNAKFDVTILKEKFNIHPPYVIDIDDLLRHYDARMSHRMKDVTEMFGLKPKGKTEDFKGLHYEQMDEKLHKTLLDYGKTDIDIEVALFKILLPLLSNPVVEIPLARHTLDLYLRPRIQFDFQKAAELQRKMQDKIDAVVVETGVPKKDLSGNKTFVKLLTEALPEGGTVPMKLGKRGNIPALAQQDDGCKWLLAHPKKEVRDLMKARQMVKSWPLHIKRIQNMTNQATVTGGKLRVPLHYYGSHTGRWSGGEKINLQNLGGRGRIGAGIDPLISNMRSLLCAPNGYNFLIVDSAQIEARLLAWIAGQGDLIDGFKNGEDIYSVFATGLFGCEVRKPIKADSDSDRKILKIRRGFGKDAILGCVAFGTPVLTNKGWKPIEKITLADKLWDGRDWVLHNGVCFKGKKPCVNVKGIWITPDHEILDKGVWFPALSLNTNNQKSEINTETLELQKLNLGHAKVLSPSNVIAPVVESLLRQEIIWSPENLHAVMSVLKRHPVKLRLIKQLCLHHTKNDCLIEFVQLLAGVKPDLLKNMVNEVFECGPIGSLIEWHFLNIWLHYQDGIIQNLKLTESTITQGIDRVILDSPPGSRTLETADILYSGDYHRFQAGNLIVANCGYGMGASTFYQRCLENSDLRPLFESGEYDFLFIKDLINIYRTTYEKIPAFWKTIEKMFKWVIKYPHKFVKYPLENNGLAEGIIYPTLLKLYKKGNTVHLQLPSGRCLTYRHARINGKGTICWHWGKLWGGSITENIIQAIARDLLGYWILEFEKNHLPVVHHSHDEIIALVKENDVDVLDDAIKLMSRGPVWAEGLPLAAEGELSKVYKK